MDGYLGTFKIVLVNIAHWWSPILNNYIVISIFLFHLDITSFSEIDIMKPTHTVLFLEV